MALYADASAVSDPGGQIAVESPGAQENYSATAQGRFASRGLGSPDDNAASTVGESSVSVGSDSRVGKILVRDNIIRTLEPLVLNQALKNRA